MSDLNYNVTSAKPIVKGKNSFVAPSLSGNVVTAAMCDGFNVITDAGAVAKTVYTLPAATSGLKIQFFRTTANVVEIDAAGSDMINIGTSSVQKMELSTNGSNVTLYGTSSGWNADVTGNWVPTIDSYTKLLLHMDDALLSDASGKTVTLNGNVARSATQSKFGGYSAYFDGSNSTISVASSSDFAFGTGDFTIDCWVYSTNITAGPVILSQSYATGNGNYSIGIINTSVSIYTYDGVSNVESVVASSASSNNTWYHIAVVRSGTTVTIYKNGVSIGSGTIAKSLGQSNTVITIGDDPVNNALQGYIDELRISKGIARWTSNFTPPTTAY